MKSIITANLPRSHKLRLVKPGMKQQRAPGRQGEKTLPVLEILFIPRVDLVGDQRTIPK